MSNLFRSFLRDEDGATSIEYALIAGLIFVVIVSSVTLMSEQLGVVYRQISEAVASAVSGGPAPDGDGA